MFGGPRQCFPGPRCGSRRTCSVCWPLETIFVRCALGGDAAVLVDYALTTTTTNCGDCACVVKVRWGIWRFWLLGIAEGNGATFVCLFVYARNSPAAGSWQIAATARLGEVRTRLVESCSKRVRLSAAPLRHFRSRDHANSCDVMGRHSAKESVDVNRDCDVATIATESSVSPTRYNIINAYVGLHTQYHTH